jgi:hypothetical protein
MGCWDIYCFICGNPARSLETMNQDTKWMNKCTMLLVTNEIIHNCRETACNVEFTDSKGNMYVHMYDDWDIVKHGIFIHTDCW